MWKVEANVQDLDEEFQSSWYLLPNKIPVTSQHTDSSFGDSAVYPTKIDSNLYGDDSDQTASVAADYRAENKIPDIHQGKRSPEIQSARIKAQHLELRTDTPSIRETF
jgi:hypothetical protein